MTIKQYQIIQAASELCAQVGYHATSTHAIAKKAQVSEGLIFRHFKNKQELFDAIIHENEVTISQHFNTILDEEDAKQVIKKTLELPFNSNDSALKLWQLQYKLKWEIGYDSTKLFKPVKDKLSHAFTQLRYRKPELEATLVLGILESVLSSIVLENINRKDDLKAFLLQKYHY